MIGVLLIPRRCGVLHLGYIGDIVERISHKKTKNQAKSDKTEHGMEKCVKAKPNQSQVNSEKKKQRKNIT
ncbi:hypothetical protein Tco_0419951 [Tanacetum coccineum]